jgi:hypothetical protein
LTWDFVRTLEFAKFIHIKANSAAEAEEQLRGTTTAESIEWKQPIRNLIYHIWRTRNNSSWRWNLEELLKRIDQFDGVRSIGVALSPESDSFEDVQSAFKGHRIDNWIIVENDPQKREGTTFFKLMDTVGHESGITFFGHAKGVSQPDGLTREWTTMMYETCLDDRVFVDEMLKQFKLVGSFKTTRQFHNQIRN